MAQAQACIVFCLCMLAAATAAHAEDDLGWHGGADEHGASLFYGIPQSDHAPLSFSCQRGDRDIAVVFAFEPVNAPIGGALEILLQAGELQVPVTTNVAWMEMDGSVVLEGRTVLDAPLVGLLAATGTLTVFAEDGAVEFPLDGAREAASGLIETCAAQDAGAAPERIVSCEISAWSTDPDPAGLNVRAAPASDAAIIGNLPTSREVGGESFATEVSITGSKDGWLRISEGWVLDYIFDDPTEIVFKGEGWVSGRHLGLLLNYRYLHGGPAADTPVLATLAGASDGLRYGPDSFLVERIHACRGRWVEVDAALTIDGTVLGPDLRGWTVGTCSNQVTTCP